MITMQEAVGLIHTNFNLDNQGISLNDFMDMFEKQKKYKGVLSDTAIFAALIKIQGAVYQNSDLLLDLTNKVNQQTALLLNIVDNINNGTAVDDNLKADVETALNQQNITNVETTRTNIVIKDFVNNLFNMVKAYCEPEA